MITIKEDMETTVMPTGTTPTATPTSTSTTVTPTTLPTTYDGYNILYQYTSGLSANYNQLNLYIDYDCENTLYGYAKIISRGCDINALDYGPLNERSAILKVNYVNIEAAGGNEFSIYSEHGDIISPVNSAYMMFDDQTGDIEVFSSFKFVKSSISIIIISVYCFSYTICIT
jgi:hypothetical protein